MAHSSLHFAFGMWIGTALMVPALWRSFKNHEKTSLTVGKLLVLSYGLALFAIIPNLLRRAGIPDNICSSPMTNIFLLHHYFDKITDGGMLKGEAGIIACFCIQYLLIVLLIRKRLPRAR